MLTRSVIFFNTIVMFSRKIRKNPTSNLFKYKEFRGHHICAAGETRETRDTPRIPREIRGKLGTLPH
jgi:hypothetical protein